MGPTSYDILQQEYRHTERFTNADGIKPKKKVNNKMKGGKGTEVIKKAAKFLPKNTENSTIWEVLYNPASTVFLLQSVFMGSNKIVADRFKCEKLKPAHEFLKLHCLKFGLITI